MLISTGDDNVELVVCQNAALDQYGCAIIEFSGRYFELVQSIIAGNVDEDVWNFSSITVRLSSLTNIYQNIMVSCHREAKRYFKI